MCAMNEKPSSNVGPPDTRLHVASDEIGGLLHRASRRIEQALMWNNIYRATSYLRSALWIIPLLSIVLVLILAPLLRIVDAWLGWRLSGLSVSGAQALYQTTITLTLSFLVFTFGSLLVAIQVAGVQLTPRIIATTLLRDNVVRYSVGLFVFTLVFAVMALNRLDKTVYDIVSLLTAMLAIACMAMFLFLIDYAARLLRPVSILARVGDEGASVIKAVYPEPASAAPEVEMAFVVPEGHRRVVPHSGGVRDRSCRRSRHLGGRCPARRRHRRVRTASGGFRVHRGTALRALWRRCLIATHRLQSSVAFGPERTIEQDPLFAFRIIADIALKALSPAINDPTTGYWHSTSCIDSCVSSVDAGCAATRLSTEPARRASSSGHRTGRTLSPSPAQRYVRMVPATCRLPDASGRCSTI